jgi:putative transposase
MNKLYKMLLISKQGVFQYSKRQEIFDEKMNQLMLECQDLKEGHPGCGVEKMYHTLKPDFLGRDRFVDTFMNLGFRVKYKKNYHRTTYASNKYYPNLIKGMEVSSPCQIWQSDITYIKVKDKFYYAVFIIDVYTKKIVGYAISNHMRATANMEALKMALKEHKAPKIHHSDRGSQYTYKEYIELLVSQNTKISMAESAQDNAYAERINRTIKEEYLDHWKIISYDNLKCCIEKAVKHYNEIRIHNNLNRVSPASFEKDWFRTFEGSKPTFFIFNHQQNNLLKTVNSI